MEILTVHGEQRQLPHEFLILAAAILLVQKIEFLNIRRILDNTAQLYHDNQREVGARILPQPPVHLFTHNVHNRKRKHWYYVQRRRYVKARNQSASIGDVERNFSFYAAATTPRLHRRKAFLKFFQKGVNKTVIFLYLLRRDIFQKFLSAYLKICLIFSIYYGSEIFLKIFLEGRHFPPGFLLKSRRIFSLPSCYTKKGSPDEQEIQNQS